MGLCGSLSDLDDCISELESLEALADTDIMVVGHSRGGYATLNIPAFHPCIKKIVAMSGFISLDVMLRQLAPFVPFVRKHIFEIERKQNPEYVDCVGSDSISCSDVAAMIVHSDDDKTVSVKTNFFKLKEDLADRPNTEFLLVTDRDHNPTFTKPAVEYKNAFFKDLKQVKKRGTLVTDEDKSAFIASYDWRKMTEQDEEIWNRIFAFLDK
jgi:pimeloyl-ACP methyl ester carboxylesterase